MHDDDKTKPSYVISVLRKENQDLRAQLNGLRQDLSITRQENQQLKEDLQRLSFDRSNTLQTFLR